MNNASSSYSRSYSILTALLLALALLLAYRNSFSTPFLFDDEWGIIYNPSIHHLASSLLPVPNGSLTVSSRPIVNFSLALNYAFGGLNLRGYHFFNLTIHWLAGLALFGVIRRTLLQPRLRANWGDISFPIAFLISLLWLLHPLQTEAVTYIIQRAESLVSLFYLLTLYCFIRSIDPDRSEKSIFRWQSLALLSSLLGMATKEIMASAPIMVFLYDSLFAAGSLRQAWKLRSRFYGAMVQGWIVLFALTMMSGGNRGGTAGLGPSYLRAYPWWSYGWAQFAAIAHYLRLVFWPNSLIFYYGILTPQGHHSPLGGSVIPGLILVLSLLTLNLIAWKRWPAAAWVGFSFFILLAPSSSIFPIWTEVMAEHRMYLPLAAVLTLTVLAGYRLFGKFAFVLGLLAAIIFGGLTWKRNQDYRSSFAIWKDTADKLPHSSQPHYFLGIALYNEGLKEAAVQEFRLSLSIAPDDLSAYPILGYILYFDFHQKEEARALLECDIQRDKELKLPFHDSRPFKYLGMIAADEGQWEKAVSFSHQAIDCSPEDPWAHILLAQALLHLHRPEEAIAALRHTHDLYPDNPEVNILLKEAQAPDSPHPLIP